MFQSLIEIIFNHRTKKFFYYTVDGDGNKFLKPVQTAKPVEGFKHFSVLKYLKHFNNTFIFYRNFLIISFDLMFKKQIESYILIKFKLFEKYLYFEV